MGRGKNRIQKFLDDIRKERIKKYGVNASFVSFDGMPSSGKDHQIGLAIEMLGGNTEFNGLKISSIRESIKLLYGTNLLRERYMSGVFSNVMSGNKENLDQTLTLYTSQRDTAYKKIIEKEGLERGLFLLNRSPYSTLAIQMLLRGLNPESDQSFDLIKRIFEPESIIPSHLAIFTICRVDIAYERAKRDYEGSKGKMEDYFDKYYKVAYAMLNNHSVVNDEEKRKWWLKQNLKVYKMVSSMVGGRTVTTGRNDNKLNPIISKELIDICREYKRT